MKPFDILYGSPGCESKYTVVDMKFSVTTLFINDYLDLTLTDGDILSVPSRLIDEIKLGRTSITDKSIVSVTGELFIRRIEVLGVQDMLTTLYKLMSSEEV